MFTHERKKNSLQMLCFATVFLCIYFVHEAIPFSIGGQWNSRVSFNDLFSSDTFCLSCILVCWAPRAVFFSRFAAMIRTTQTYGVELNWTVTSFINGLQRLKIYILYELFSSHFLDNILNTIYNECTQYRIVRFISWMPVCVCLYPEVLNAHQTDMWLTQ